VLEPSFVVPGFPEEDDRHLPPLVTQKLFFDALYAGRQALLRAEDERNEEAEEARWREEEEYARQVEQDLKKARAEEAEYARMLEEDLKKAEAARRRAEIEDFARLLEEDMRKAQEAHRRAVEQEEKRRRAEQESMERERRECERRERERREREDFEALQSNLAKRLRVYEEKWAALRSNIVWMERLGFCDIPWPLFENIQGVEDITEERVLAFVCHPLHEHVQGPGEGQAKSLRSEMLRWHPDKFEGKVLDKVVEGDREAVREAAGYVARILTKFSVAMR
jgi:hypothetical protein